MRIVDMKGETIVEFGKKDMIFIFKSVDNSAIYMCNKKKYEYGSINGNDKVCLYISSDDNEINEAFQYIVHYESLSFLKERDTGHTILTDGSTIDTIKLDTPIVHDYEFLNVSKVCNLQQFKEEYQSKKELIE